MAYDLDYLDTANGLSELFAGVNTMTGSLLTVVIVVIISILVFVAFSGFDIKKVLIIDGFITTIISVLFWAGGYAGFIIVTYPVILLFAGIILTLSND